MVKVYKDLTGMTFGKLTVLEQAEDYINPSGRHFARWLCECSCEEHNQVIVNASNLKSGKTVSCGCFAIEQRSKRFKKIASELNKKNKSKTNKYELSGDYGVGWTLNTNEEFYFDLEDYDKIKDYCWVIANDGYAKSTVHYKDKDNKDKKYTVLMHRIIMNPENNKIYIDHKHGEDTRNDNRKYNLRFATPSQNSMNRGLQSNNTYGTTGVYWNKRKNKWTAGITFQKKKYYLGDYDRLEDAVKARKEAEEEYYGEYAYDVSVKANNKTTCN